MNLNLDQIVAAATLTGIRTSGLIVAAPFLGSSAVPIKVKVALSVAITSLLYPLCHPRLSIAGPIDLAQMATGEALLGLGIGLTVNIVFEAAQFAGQVVGIQVGYSLVNLIDPQTQVDTPVLGTFHQLIMMLIFLRLGAHHWLLRALAKSFSYVTPGSVVINRGTVDQLFHYSASIWLSGLQIAAPVLLATLVCDVGMGFLGRASPQLPILSLGLSIKVMLGLTVMIGTLRYWPGKFEQYFVAAIALAERSFRLVAT